LSLDTIFVLNENACVCALNNDQQREVLLLFVLLSALLKGKLKSKNTVFKTEADRPTERKPGAGENAKIKNEALKSNRNPPP
jgi:hypothetical protein